MAHSYYLPFSFIFELTALTNDPFIALFLLNLVLKKKGFTREIAKRPGNMARKSWFRYFQYDERKETPADARNVLLIVAGLIAAVTFQAGVNPPGGVWQDNENGHTAGRAIYSYKTKEFYVFLISNTLAFSTSILLLISLTHKFPFHFELILATASMVATYASSVFAVTPDDLVKFRYILLAAAVPFIIRCLLQVWNRLTMEEQPYEKHIVFPDNRSSGENELNRV